jgi:hypothetical protein
MWPWDHLAIGYLAYAAGVRVRRGGAPSSRAAVAVALGSQFPDLVDKPLAWSLGVLPSGTSLAHSLLFALPVCWLVGSFARRHGAGDAGVAFAVGYLLHLPADAVYGFLLGGSVSVGFFFWPLVPAIDRPPVGLFTRTGELFEGFLRIVATPAGLRYLALDVLLFATAVGVWLRDGTPGTDLVSAAFDAVRARS